MHELFDQIFRLLRGIWRYRWYTMLVAWLGCMVGWVMVYQLPDEYQASARVHVDTDSMLKPLLSGIAVNTNTTQRVNLMTRTLLSRPNLEKLARMTDLDLLAKSPEQMEALLDGLAEDIRIASTNRQNLYTITYDNSDRDLAKRVVQSLLTIFVEGTLGDKRAESDTAQQFLVSQIKEYEAKLTAAEERLSEFKRRNVGMMPGEGQDYYTRLQTVLGDLQAARLQLAEAQRRRDTLKRQMEGEEISDFNISQPLQDSALANRINTLQTRLDELLLVYTDKHPDVIELRRTIKDLEAQLEEEQALAADNEPGAVANPLYQQMKMSLWEANAQIASMQARVREYESRASSLQNMVDTIPKVEAELARLNRDYNVNRANYEALLGRRESAKISEQAEISGDDVKFRVVDPPRVPLTPSGPDRPMLMTMVLFGSFGVGLGLAFVLYQIRPTFDDIRTLKDVTGLPVLGAVSRLQTREFLVKRRLAFVTFSIAGAGLLAIYAALIAIQLVDVPLLKELSDLGEELL